MRTTLQTSEVLILLLILTVLVTIAQVYGRKKSSWQPGRKTRRRPVEAAAIILNINSTGKHTRLKKQVEIQLQVIPATGRNFVVELKTLLPVNELSLLEEGASVRVRYNPQNLATICLIDN